MSSHVNHSLRVGVKLNDYRIQSILGRGAFGITYLAYDTNLQQLVAIKEYLPQEFAKRNEDNMVYPLSKDKEKIFNYGLSSFLREARTVAKFKHPNIIRILSYFHHNNTAYIVMEYEKGQTFNAHVKAGGDVSETYLLSVFHAINKGLAVVHQYKEEGDKETSHYIHRDIKPDNIIIREDNTPVLIDFGIARDVATSEELTRIFTKFYAPFEQYDPTWASQGPWTDIYALGATLYFAITNKRIPPAESRAFNDRYQALANSDYTKKYSSHFLYAIDKALKFHPNDRPKDIEEWDQALRLNIYNIEVTNTSLPRRPILPSIYENKSSKEKIFKNKQTLFIFMTLFLFLATGFYSYLMFNHQIDISSEVLQFRAQNNDSSKNQEIKLVADVATQNSMTGLPKDLNTLIDFMQDRLKSQDIEFNELVNMLDRVNEKMNKDFYTEVRLLYLNVLQKILDVIPSDLQKKHDDWLYQHRNNIENKNNSEYKILDRVRKDILENKNLYGSLVIKSFSIALTVNISGNNSICTLNNPCITPITQGKIHAGKKTIQFNNDKENIHIEDIINIHPNQDYVLHLNIKSH